MSKLRGREGGSILVMAVIFGFVSVLIGVVFLQSALYLRSMVTDEICARQSQYTAQAGMIWGLAQKLSGHPIFGDLREFYEGNYFGCDIIYGGIEYGNYGYQNTFALTGKGKASFQEMERYTELSGIYNYETYADYLYITDKERDSERHVPIRFWESDTLDGKVHSNDTIRVMQRPLFLKRVTTSMGYIDPPNNNADFREDWGYRPPIHFPDQATEIRANSGFTWRTAADTIIELTLSGDQIRYRKCYPFDVSGEMVMRCNYPSIASAPYTTIPITGVVFVYGKCWIKSSRGRIDRMDGEFPEQSFTDGDFISDGLRGQLTIGCSDSMIIPDNIIYYGARSDLSVPPLMDSCSDVLGLVSERAIVVGETVPDTVYINAALAAIKGSISVQDIYENYPPGWDNEKRSLFIWGCLAQRNRGIIHTTDYPDGHLRGFREKDYHYDVRLQENPPPHYLPTLSSDLQVVGDLYSGSGDEGGG